MQCRYLIITGVALTTIASGCGSTPRDTSASSPASAPATVSAPAPEPTKVPATSTPRFAPDILPGRGLAQHDFFYAGEDKVQTMYQVKGGKVAWSHTIPNSKGEISDAILRANGAILLAHQFGVTEIDQTGTVLWHLEAPAGTEIHTAQPVDDHLVMYVQNGNPAQLVVVDKRTGAEPVRFNLPVRAPTHVHGQFRHARMTSAGTFLVAHMDLGEVREYDKKGTQIWSVAAPGVWSATRLANGNTLIAGSKLRIWEVDPQGKLTWEFTQADIPTYRLQGTQLAWRLANGNTLINNWTNPWSTRVDPANAPVQAVEVTPDKQVVWALRSWEGPDQMGTATTIQLLDEPINPAWIEGKL